MDAEEHPEFLISCSWLTQLENKKTELLNVWKLVEPAINCGLCYAEVLAFGGADTQWAKDYRTEMPIAKIELAQWDSAGALALLEVPIPSAPWLDS